MNASDLSPWRPRQAEPRSPSRASQGPGVGEALSALTGGAATGRVGLVCGPSDSPAAGCSIRRSCCGCRARVATRAKIAPNCISHGGHSGRRRGDQGAAKEPGLACLPSPVNSHGERSRTAGLDLSRTSAVADLVDAETDSQRQQALDQLDGALARRHAAWRDELTRGARGARRRPSTFRTRTRPPRSLQRRAPRVTRVMGGLDEALADGERGERVREGYRIAIIGAPNAGKSSLLNALAGRPAAIVTATPGATRDVIEVPMNIAGYRVLLADTAGLRVARDAIEARWCAASAGLLAASAALRVLVVDRRSGPDARWREGRLSGAAGGRAGSEQDRTARWG